MRRKYGLAALAVAVVGLAIGFWPRWEYAADGTGWWSLGLGAPWVRHEGGPDGFRTEADLITWSAAAGLVGLFGLAYLIAPSKSRPSPAG